MLPEKRLQRVGAKGFVVWNHFDDTGEVCKEVSLVLVGENSRYAGIVELDFLVMYLDEMDSGVPGDERYKSSFNLGRYRALGRNLC